MTAARDQARSDERWFDRVEILAEAPCPMCLRHIKPKRARGRIPTYCSKKCRDRSTRERANGRKT